MADESTNERIRAKLQAFREQYRPTRIARVRSQMNSLVPNGKVPLQVAKKFVAASAWWHSHPSGNPVRAPGRAKQVVAKGDGNWKVKYGANYFLVSDAIVDCLHEICTFLKHVEEDKPWSRQELVDDLKFIVSGCVEVNGGRYEEQYPLTENDMMFGTHSINVEDFANQFIQHIPASFYAKEKSGK